MPYIQERDPDHAGKWRIRDTATGDIKGSDMTQDAATRQFQALEEIERGRSGDVGGWAGPAETRGPGYGDPAERRGV
jgi:hypothetical protein